MVITEADKEIDEFIRSEIGKNLSDDAQSLYIFLKIYANKHGKNSIPTFYAIEKYSGLSREQAVKAHRELESRELASKEDYL